MKQNEFYYGQMDNFHKIMEIYQMAKDIQNSEQVSKLDKVKSLFQEYNLEIESNDFEDYMVQLDQVIDELKMVRHYL